MKGAGGELEKLGDDISAEALVQLAIYTWLIIGPSHADTWHEVLWKARRNSMINTESKRS
jgi:hypothetical protein